MASKEEESGPLVPGHGQTCTWALWWCSLGGFQWANPCQTKPNGWTALMHACDMATASQRAAFAALRIIEENANKPDVCEFLVNQRTQDTRPYGYQALHLACDGSDAGFMKVRIVSALLRIKAPIEDRESRNGRTPLLIAAASGLTDVVKLLLEWGADISATSANNKGVAQLAMGTSKTLGDFLWDYGAPWITGSTPRPQRQFGTISDSRLARQTNGDAFPNSAYGPGGSRIARERNKAFNKGKQKGKVYPQAADSQPTVRDLVNGNRGKPTGKGKG